MRGKLKLLFNKCDKGGDGVLNKREFQQLVLLANRDKTVPVVTSTRTLADRTLHVRKIYMCDQDEIGNACDAAQKLEDLFSKFGDVCSVTVRRKPVDESGVDASWALVTMTTPEDADKTLSAQVLAPDGVTILPLTRYNPKQAAASKGAAHREFLAHPARQDLLSAAQVRSSTNDSEFDVDTAWEELEKVSNGGFREDGVKFPGTPKSSLLQCDSSPSGVVHSSEPTEMLSDTCSIREVVEIQDRIR